MRTFIRFIIFAFTSALITSCAGIGSQEFKGVVAITPEYEWAGNFSEGLAAVKVNGLVGYISKAGEMVIEPQFNFGYGFVDGHALVLRTPASEAYDENYNFIGEYELIDKSGKSVKKFGKGITVSTNLVDQEREDPVTYISTDSEFCTYLNTQGEILLNAKFKSCGAFVSKLAPVEDIKTSKTGYINPLGDWKIEPKFASASSFSDGLASASLSSKISDYTTGYINMKGEWVINPQFWLAAPFFGGIARVVDCDGCEKTAAYSYGKHGFIDKKGNFIIQKKYNSYVSKYYDDPGFHEGFAIEWLGSGWTFINKDEVPISEKRFGNVSRFRDGYALVKVNQKWGYINRAGKITVRPQFEDASMISEGYAAVKIAGLWGFIK
jgi:hypothetical protein